jgi:hypothetical protein
MTAGQPTGSKPGRKSVVRRQAATAIATLPAL